MKENAFEFLATLEATIADRINNPGSGSYTADLIAQGAKRIAQKVGEEGVELALAGVAGDRDEITNEAADLLYHMLVLLSSQKLSLTDVVTTLESRHQA